MLMERSKIQSVINESALKSMKYI